MFPEGMTPLNCEDNVLMIWNLNVAVQIVEQAAYIMRCDFHKSTEYRKINHEFNDALHKYKKLLKHTIDEKYSSKSKKMI